MAAGEARKLHASNGLPVIILSSTRRPIWSALWEGNPYIVKRYPGVPVNRLVNGPGVRPYIAGKTETKWRWKPYKPIPAEVFFTAEEKAFAERYRGMVMIEPHVKTIGHQNKAWIWARWIELAQTLRKIDHQTVQCGVPGTEFLAHAATAVTPTFRLAAAVLSVAKAFIGTEGGLMHAAAAVGTPAVILWAEFISPEITGYSSLKNLRHAGKPCGMRVDCPGCRKSMEAITVDEVIGALKEILK